MVECIALLSGLALIMVEIWFLTRKVEKRILSLEVRMEFLIDLVQGLSDKKTVKNHSIENFSNEEKKKYLRLLRRRNGDT